MKRIISLLLVVVICCTMLPQIALKTKAVYEWIKNRADVDGYDYTTSDKLAKKLNTVFDGNASVYANKSCTTLVNTKVGNKTVPNNGVTQYIDEMKNISSYKYHGIPNWNYDLSSLKRLRHLRNQMAHN